LSSEIKRSFLAAMEKSHGRRLRRFLSARLRNSADVPDLVQEVFLRLLRIDHHESIRNPQAYLYTVARHVLHQHALHSSVTSEVVRFSDVIASLDGGCESDPALEVEVDQSLEVLARSLEEYSPRAYATLILHRCEGIPLKEIAVRFGVSYTMAKRYLAQALAYCQQRLNEME
jgi:RNA polymerase sigma factor (sigma-70 family)